MSRPTAIRKLVFFLADIGAISDHTAAVYLVESRLKHASVSELIEDMRDMRRDDDEHIRSRPKSNHLCTIIR